jgi:hypothetical protein
MANVMIQVYHSDNPTENDISPVDAQKSTPPISNSGRPMLSSIETATIGHDGWMTGRTKVQIDWAPISLDKWQGVLIPENKS